MFEITNEDGDARIGSLNTAHGKIPTPFYMPVATKGSVKFLNTQLLKKIGMDCIISNSLILSWKPGLELIEKAGGIHKLINWDGGIFTDSGGFQSLDFNMLQKTTDKAAFFKSPFNGTTFEISPERAMEIQKTIGSDVAMCLDEVPLHNDDERTIRSKTLRTHTWAKRCLKHHEEIDGNRKQMLFGIAQGGNFLDMRKKSIEFISKLDFDGIAQGGLAIGEPIEKMYSTLSETCRLMPKEKARYLMGVGNPVDILEAISYGVDCFDSTFPTQNARHGTIFTMQGKLRIHRKEHQFDLGPIEEGCDCLTCKNYSRAFVRHSLSQKEGVGYELATIHNIRFMQRLIESVRLAISENRFNSFKTEMQEKFRA